METRNSRVVTALFAGLAAFCVAGCTPAQPKSPEEAVQPAATAVVSENQQVAEAVLGKTAEILAQGDLPHNGSEQLLVVNRVERAARGGAGPANPSPIFVTRAVIVEKDNGKWAEVLRCDEHLKNPRGYLAGAPADRVTGWELEFKTDTELGIELRFKPAATGDESASSTVEAASRTIAVRWNAKAKRYQSLDQSHKGYVGEVPTMGTPQSILR